ncbi:MAG TPA: hypothetical protein VLW50_17535 [Streptosporangiaceae bacterium]|nr:hypothetical protein [Streptosporangiaceae bacterium]
MRISATFVAASTLHGLPTLTGFSTTFAVAAVFLAGCAVAGVLIPARPLTVVSLQAVTSPEAD